MSCRRKQKIPKDIGPRSIIGTQSTTAKRDVHLCKKALKNFSFFLISFVFEVKTVTFSAGKQRGREKKGPPDIAPKSFSQNGPNGALFFP